MSWKELVPHSPWSPGKTRAEALHPLVEMERQMRELTDSFFGRGLSKNLLSNFETFVPSIDVSEDEEKVTVAAEIPGLDPKQVDMTFDGGVLYLKGEKKTEREEGKGTNHYFAERTYGSFERAIPIRAEIDEDKIRAESKNGVLRIVLPKSVDSKTKRRKISVA